MTGSSTSQSNLTRVSGVTEPSRRLDVFYPPTSTLGSILSASSVPPQTSNSATSPMILSPSPADSSRQSSLLQERRLSGPDEANNGGMALPTGSGGQFITSQPSGSYRLGESRRSSQSNEKSRLAAQSLLSDQPLTQSQLPPSTSATSRHGSQSHLWDSPAAPPHRNSVGALSSKSHSSYSFSGPSAASVADAEAFRGGVAWGPLVSTPQQRSYSDSGRIFGGASLSGSGSGSSSIGSSSASFSQARRPSTGLLLGPEPLLPPINPLGSSGMNKFSKNNFTGPQISLLDQFSSLADATRHAELSRRVDTLNMNGTSNSVPMGTAGSVSASSSASVSASGSPPSADTPPRERALWNPKSTFSPQGSSVTVAPYAENNSNFISGSSALHQSPLSSHVAIQKPLQSTTRPLSPLSPPQALGQSSGQDRTDRADRADRADRTDRTDSDRSSPQSSQSSSLDTQQLAPELATNKPPVRRRDYRRLASRRSESPLLEELRSNKKNLTISSIIGSVYEVSTDQHGSRFIQENLAVATPESKEEFFREANQNLLQLMTDVFGNYVIQQLFELGTPEQQSTMVQQIRGRVLILSLQMYGCRVVQMALRHSQPPEQAVVVNELRGHVVRCIKDHNGNHVIQKAVECLSPDHVQFIYEGVLENAVELSKHMYGCRVVQRILEHGDIATKDKLLGILRQHISSLVVDQYGNYVVQHVVDNGPDVDRQAILDELLPQVLKLSTHKYASNVIEKCFIRGSPSQRREMINRILLSTSSPGSPPVVVGMIKDQYANYVIQKILVTANTEDYARLTAAIRPHLSGLKRGSFGKHIAAIERLIGQ